MTENTNPTELLGGITLDGGDDHVHEPACEINHLELDGNGEHRAIDASRRLADHTTMRVGGEADELIIATTTDDLVAAIGEADDAGTPVLVLSGGSNMVVGDEGFRGRVVRVATRGISADVSDCAGAFVTVEAGENWDDFVALAVEKQWIGVETLSGIPGLVGSTPIQNVGAYGAEVAQVIARVRAWDRQTRAFKTFFPADCDFAYRMSRFKAEPGRWVIVQVSFQFELGPLSEPIRYPELANALDVEVGGRAPLAQVREAVLSIRASKGMVLDPAEHDTWSAGSFFTNPLLAPEMAATLPEDAPRFPQPDGRIKSSAAWLISHAGFQKGHPLQERPDAPASLSTRHSLALTNRGTATAADIVALAREVRDGVEKAYGIRLVPEPVTVGCEI